MKSRHVISLAIVTLMVLSGFAVLADYQGQSSVQTEGTPSVSPPTLYELTFRANGLNASQPGGENWYGALYNSTAAYPLYGVNGLAYVNVTAGTYYYQANDSYYNLFGISASSPTFSVNSNMTIPVNFTPAQKIVFSSSQINSQAEWGVNVQSTNFPATTALSPSQTVAGGSTVTYYAVPGDFTYSWYDLFGNQNISMGSSDLYLGTANLSVKLPVSSYSNVTFTESGLASGTSWYALQVNGPVINHYYNETSGTSLKLAEVSGLNTFAIGYLTNGVRVNVTTVTLEVGSIKTYNVPFPALYMVNLSAANLPAPLTYTGWGVDSQFYLNGFNDTLVAYTTINDYVTFLAPNLTMTVTPFLSLSPLTGGTGSGYVANSTSTDITVSGSSVIKAITLQTLEQVSLSVNGIPGNLGWTLLSGSSGISGYVNNGVTSPTATFLAANGSYTFNLKISSSFYEMVPLTFTVNGASKIINLQLYNTTFKSSSNSQLDLSLYREGLISVASASASGPGLPVDLYLPNGTYHYFSTLEVPPTGLNYLNEYSNGSVMVAGSNLTVKQGFTTQFYTLDIVVTGVPGGANWGLDIRALNNSVSGHAGGTGNSSTTVQLPTGTYEVSQLGQTELNNDFYFVNSSTVSVSLSSPYTASFHYSTHAYTQFVEYGLPQGTTWSVSEGGKTVSSDTSTLSVGLDSGIQDTPLNFTVGNVPGYTSNPQAGSFVNQQQIPSQQVIPVTFNPSAIIGSQNGISTYDASANTLHNGAYMGNGNFQVYSVAFDYQKGTTYIAYGTDSGTAGIEVLNSSTMSLIKNVALPGESIPNNILVDSATGMAYISYSFNSYYYVASMNLNSYSIQVTPFYGNSITDIMIGPNNGQLYVAAQNGVYALNQSTMVQTAYISLDGFDGEQGPYTLLYSQTNNMIYAVGYSFYTIYSINPGTDTIVSSYTIPHNNYIVDVWGGAAMDTLNGNIYIEFTQYALNYSSPEKSYIVEFNTSNGVFQTPVYIGAGWNYNVTYDAASNMLYIPLQISNEFNSTFGNQDVGMLKEYSLSTGRVVNTFETGLMTYQVNINEHTGKVFVTNRRSGDVNIITPGVYGYLKGTVDSTYATVLVDGVYVPLYNEAFNVSLSPGTYHLTAFDPNQAPIESTVMVSAYTTTSLTLEVSKQQSAYEVTGQVSPGQASVTFNGISADVNSTGYYTLYLPLGNYTLSAYLQGYFPLSQQVHLTGSTVVNLSLSKEPSPTEVVTSENVTFEGFNVTAANVTSGNGNISLTFNSTGNGILTIAVPFQDLKNVNVSDILHSRLYINGVQYTNFTVTISSNYTIVLKVMGLNADPQLEWVYSPNVTVPPLLQAPSSPLLLYVIIIVVVGAAAATGFVFYSRRKNKP